MKTKEGYNHSQQLHFIHYSHHRNINQAFRNKITERYYYYYYSVRTIY